MTGSLPLQTTHKSAVRGLLEAVRAYKVSSASEESRDLVREGQRCFNNLSYAHLSADLRANWAKPEHAAEWVRTETQDRPMPDALLWLLSTISASLEDIGSDSQRVAAAVTEVESALLDRLGSAEISAARLRIADGEVLEWPTVEWVKVPVDVLTGLPNGAPITERHFCDCDRWPRDGGESWVGEPPALASDKQMAALPACKKCVLRAQRSGHNEHGPRVAGSHPAEHTREQKEFPLPPLLDLDDTDVAATVRVRREQAHLRRHLFAGREEGECALCGKCLPASLLIAAHIVPRRELDDAERLDFRSAAMIACALGCDVLFELGYVVVDADGKLTAGRSAEGAVADIVDGLLGRDCGAFNEETATRFQRHLLLHARDR